jgi:hypothetical protein
VWLNLELTRQWGAEPQGSFLIREWRVFWRELSFAQRHWRRTAFAFPAPEGA